MPVIRVLAGLLVLAALPAGARDCRPPADAPPGVRVEPPPGCRPVTKPETAARPVERPGFVRLPDGTEIRIGGRVRIDAGAIR